MAKLAPPTHLPDRLGGVSAAWLITTSALVVIESRKRPKHALAIVMTSKPPGKKVGVLAIEAAREDIARSPQAVLARHSHELITRGATVERALALIDAYVVKWLAAKPHDRCACKPIKTGRARPTADGQGCQREVAARRRRRRS